MITESRGHSKTAAAKLFVYYNLALLVVDVLDYLISLALHKNSSYSLRGSLFWSTATGTYLILLFAQT